MKNSEYNHIKIENKWQKEWDRSKIYQAKTGGKKKPFYGLIEFPYPSAVGLHVGHIRSNTAMDIITRKRRMEGYNVLYPIGWDAFGLPTENYAIKMGMNPAIVTKKNTDIFRKQLKSVGFGFDWSREVNTTDPLYYKWTQWIFLQMFKKGLAYKNKTEINWCTSCKIGLANEEVVGGVCERCGGQVVKKEKEQWMLAITKYADRLDKDLDDVNYLEKIKIQQRNWIGKSEGAIVKFQVKDSDNFIEVFTTRVDTIFSGTFLVLAPEHSFIKENKKIIKNILSVEKFIEEIKNKPDIERTSDDNKTGLELQGVKAINPANGKEISVWISDFVLISYGTGAVFADAHDKRDFDMAKRYNIPLSVSIKPQDDKLFERVVSLQECFEGEGVLFNSGEFDGLTSKEARPKIIEWLALKNLASKTVKYKLRDWVFSRQRYWGEPIPLINCDKCGWVPVSEKNLPVLLPKVKSYQPTDNGDSPLANISKWVNTKCPKCKGKAKRETDTMPNWAGSSWYFLRYTDSKNKKELASKKALKYWMKNGVDWYNGGMEHTTLHLLYSRFWHKFLYDLKIVPTREPYMKRTSHGMILAEGGVKMSKSIGNTIDPKDIVNLYGADTLRIYEMFIGPFDQAVSWNTDSIIGSRRFIEKVWRIGMKIITNEELRITNDKNFDNSATFQTLLHKTIKKITEDIESMSFNTAISSMMVLVNEMEKSDMNKKDFEMFLQILSPFAPHIAEELWSQLGNKKSIHLSPWPKWDKKKIVEEKIKIAIQVNGKVRSEIIISKDMNEDQIKKIAIEDKDIIIWISGKEVKKFIYVPLRIINIVI